MIQRAVRLAVKLVSNKLVEAVIITAVVSAETAVARNVKCILQSAQTAVYKRKSLFNLPVKNLSIAGIVSNPCAVTRKFTKGQGVTLGLFYFVIFKKSVSILEMISSIIPIDKVGKE